MQAIPRDWRSNHPSVSAFVPFALRGAQPHVAKLEVCQQPPEWMWIGTEMQREGGGHPVSFTRPLGLPESTITSWL